MATIEKEITVGPSYLNRQPLFSEESVRGTLSPYDIPIKAVIRFDSPKKLLAIEFVYMTPNEPKQQIKSVDDVTLETGKYSGKLYSIMVHKIHKHGLAAALIEVGLAVDQAQRKFQISRPVDQAPLLNLSFVKDILSVIGERIESLEVADDI